MKRCGAAATCDGEMTRAEGSACGADEGTAEGGPGGDGWPGRWLEAAAGGYVSV